MVQGYREGKDTQSVEHFWGGSLGDWKLEETGALARWVLWDGLETRLGGMRAWVQ